MVMKLKIWNIVQKETEINEFMGKFEEEKVTYEGQINTH